VISSKLSVLSTPAAKADAAKAKMKVEARMMTELSVFWCVVERVVGQKKMSKLEDAFE
jgi:hypothetical protein